MLRRNRPWMAGGAIGLAACLHAFPALLLLYFAIRFRRALVSAIGAIALLGAAAAALSVPHTFGQWLDTAGMVAQRFVPRPSNQSVAGLITSLSGGIGCGENVRVVAPAVVLIVAAALALFLWPWNRGSLPPERLDVEYSVFMAAMLLASPLSWARYLPIVLVTGSCGLIGSEVSVYFSRQGYQVFGIDSNHRAVFFGPEGDTSWVLERLRREIPGYRHQSLDIRDREGVLALLKELRPNLIIHTAAQPSHDRGRHPVPRFRSQCAGHSPPAGSRAPVLPRVAVHPHVHQQGLRRPAQYHPLRELETRWDYADPAFENGIPRISPSTNPSIRCSARPKSPAT
jgi:hypothetical protein